MRFLLIILCFLWAAWIRWLSMKLLSMEWRLMSSLARERSFPSLKGSYLRYHLEKVIEYSNWTFYNWLSYNVRGCLSCSHDHFACNPLNTVSVCWHWENIWEKWGNEWSYDGFVEFFYPNIFSLSENPYGQKYCSEIFLGMKISTSEFNSKFSDVQQNLSDKGRCQLIAILEMWWLS